MMRFVVTEKESDAALLRKCLDDAGWDDVVVNFRGSKMKAISYAKTISINEDAPAAVVLNANTEDEDELQVLRSEFQDLIGPLPPDIAPILVLGAPTIAGMVDEQIIEELESFLSGGRFGTVPVCPAAVARRTIVPSSSNPKGPFVGRLRRNRA
ncbi:hypothetical protein [Ensifer canadensis]